MELFNKVKVVTIATCLGCGFPFNALATNGMNPEGTGVKSRGMGGAGVAVANEAASVTNNPANLADVGERTDFAIGLFSPDRSYTLTGNNLGGGATLNASQESENELFVIPFFGMTGKLDENTAWSFIINANGGMNSEYTTNFGTGLGGSGKTSINLEQVFLTLTFASNVGESSSFGVTTILALQRVEATGLAAFGSRSSDNTKLSNNGVDSSTGFGFKIGFKSQLNDAVKWGVTYQPIINMSEFERYAGLFEDGGDLDIPATFTIGLAWQSSPDLLVAFDYHYIDYDGVAAIGNDTSLVATQDFGTAGGPGFGWDSINVYKLGFEYKYSSDLLLRVGWNHGQSPVKSGEASVAFLAPAVNEDHLNLGFTYSLDKASELSMNFVHSIENTVSGSFSPIFGGGNMSVTMEQNFIELGYSKLF